MCGAVGRIPPFSDLGPTLLISPRPDSYRPDVDVDVSRGVSAPTSIIERLIEIEYACVTCILFLLPVVVYFCLFFLLNYSLLPLFLPLSVDAEFD